MKNLYAHRPRNQKTAAMFTLCVGFVIFAATMFVLQANSIPQNLEWNAGSDIVRHALPRGSHAPPPFALLRSSFLGRCTQTANPTAPDARRVCVPRCRDRVPVVAWVWVWRDGGAR